eukprot:CAMPEP_0172471646 /NCGR_PEP_ID=MMETSP1065-20121228/67924_1 /TAXON_ID=265537 /ORGANISM="Amphiprora paludosa, Strain CCMP125" /LENGTH=626 /DNA_ID=CAMNT_0013229753 /DNA_START=33 /DNA_END=1914 /DNA_ORIENTATION=-
MGKKKTSSKAAVPKKPVEEEEAVDYGATADAFFQGQGLEDDSDVVGGKRQSKEEEDAKDDADIDDEEQVEDKSDNASDDSDESEEEEEEDQDNGPNNNDDSEEESDDDEEEEEEENEEEEPVHADHVQIEPPVSSNGEQDKSDNASDDSDESEEEEEEDQDNGPNNNDDSEEESDDDEEEEEEENEEEEPVHADHVQIEPPVSSNGEPCTFDLRNLLALNAHQINTTKLYQKKRNSQSTRNDPTTIALPDQFPVVNEDYLLEKALDGCGQLVGALWQLPKEKSDVGTMVQLPSFDASRVPRALPPPAPKEDTKWEKFAKDRGIPLNKANDRKPRALPPPAPKEDTKWEKFAKDRGIPLNKSKRSQKVWDEATGEWMFRHGFNKANDGATGGGSSKEWPIMEVKGGDDPFADPWEKQREAKRARVDKNTEQRLRNQERTGNLAKGTTHRLMKNREKTRQAGKKGGNLDRDGISSVQVLATGGVPVDLKATKTSGPVDSLKRGKQSTLAALAATQRSTASMGRFDKLRQDEPERRNISSKNGSAREKRKAQTGSSLQKERERSLQVLKTVVSGGGAAKERDIKKGRYAKGETAYDYDFNDGLDASSFRKKKGRGGAGMAKKMTKKRIR